jgi:hypothetical protein
VDDQQDIAPRGLKNSPIVTFVKLLKGHGRNSKVFLWLKNSNYIK